MDGEKGMERKGASPKGQASTSGSTSAEKPAEAHGVCAVVGAADLNEHVLRAQRLDHVIAADAGWQALADAGVEADEAVGDFDSLGRVPDAPKVVRFPPEKDDSDLALAAKRALGLGYRDLVFFGCLSRRLDHTLAAIAVMRHAAAAGARVKAAGPGFGMAVVTPSCPFRLAACDPAPMDAGEYGRFVSVFAVGGAALGVTEEGMKYALADAELPDDVSLGLSNELTGAPVSVSVRQGQLLVTFPDAAWSALR